MKSTYFFVLTLAFLFQSDFSVVAQNLVLNPSFETTKPSKKAYKSCHFIRYAKTFNDRLNNWNTFSGMTPDLIIRPDTLEGCFYPTPHSGQNMVGMIMYHPKEDTGYDYDYHETIQGKLKTPLIAGTIYKISVWVYFDAKIGVEHLDAVYGRKTSIYPITCNNLGFLFSKIPFGANENVHKTLEEFDINPQVVFEDIMLTSKGKWQKMSITFLAKSNYKYFLMGNFSSDFMTNTQPDDFEERFPLMKEDGVHFFNRPKRIAYYCFDDIDIRPYNGEKLNIEEALAIDKVYVFKNLNFESGRAILREEAFSELINLSEWLTKNDEKKVEIGGHTDAVGNNDANQLLSEKRAAVVYRYLLKQGIDKTRLHYKGYGESQPKTTNKTAAGRKINRRVECKILEIKE